MTSFYIKKPHFTGFDNNSLHYIDVLTYVTIRSFDNYTDKECFPAYETIAERMGASRSLVIKSVKRLVQAGYLIKRRRYDQSNLYFFPNADIVDKIPVEVLELDISIYEKAMLLLLRQCCVGTRINISGNIKDIADKLGLSYKVVYTQIKSLVEKGLVTEFLIYKSNTYVLSNLIDWSYSTDAGTGYSKGSVDDVTILIGDDRFFVLYGS